LGRNFHSFFDSGLRSGEDITKAYARGADFTFVGRILQFAIAAAGKEGLHRLWQVMCKETEVTLAQIGLCNLRSAEIRSAIAFLD
jgi:L-lactate dehydrogenase (cytochrome)